MENNPPGTDFRQYLDIPIDGTLLTEDGFVFNIHKFPLAQRSAFFTALYCGKWKDNTISKISGIEGHILREILLFIYTGNIRFRNENIRKLMIAADYLLLGDVFFSRLGIFLKNNICSDNCFSYYVSSMYIQRHDMISDCYRFVQTHFEDAINSNSVGFGELSFESLKQFLCDRNLCVSSEKTVFISIIKWVMSDKLNRQCFVPDLLICMAADHIDENLASFILEDDLVINNPFCQHIIDTKESFQNAHRLEILQTCLYLSSNVEVKNFNCRLPTKMYCVAIFSAHEARHITEFYVTYDENIDLWRKVHEVEFVQKFVISWDSIFLIRRQNRIVRYSIPEDQLYDVMDFIEPRSQYVLTILDRQIYALGGISDNTGEEIYDVEVYDPEYNIWYHRIPPMIPISAFCAVSLYKSIYVVGYRLNVDGFEMIAQVYHKTSESWSLLPPVSVDRSHFALVAYREKVYVIGGMRVTEYLNDVEMFDPEKNIWTDIKHLPHAYIVPKAIVLNDVLIVHDNHREDRKYRTTYPPVFWNTQNESWESFEESSPMNKLYLHHFCAIVDRESIASLTIANRKPGACFERSSFA